MQRECVSSSSRSRRKIPLFHERVTVLSLQNYPPFPLRLLHFRPGIERRIAVWTMSKKALDRNRGGASSPGGSPPPRRKGSPREGRCDRILAPSPTSLLSVSSSLARSRRARFRAISPQIGEGKTLIFIPSKCVISPARLETLRSFPSLPHPPLPVLQPSRVAVPWCRARVCTHTRARTPPGAELTRRCRYPAPSSFSSFPLSLRSQAHSHRHPPGRHLYCLPLVWGRKKRGTDVLRAHVA